MILGFAGAVVLPRVLWQGGNLLWLNPGGTAGPGQGAGTSPSKTPLRTELAPLADDLDF